jgi:dTMP kinase
VTAHPGGRGRLIVLEGIDGSGKSSVARRLAERWRRRGLNVVQRREPSTPRLGRSALALARSDPWASALVFSLDRLLARPAVEADLARGRIVLQDRSYFSTLAYQADRLAPEDRDRILALQARVGIVPDRVLWLDLPPEVALRRVADRGGRRDDVERVAFLRAVRGAYRRLEAPPRWIRVDASQSLPQVVDELDDRLSAAVRPATARPASRR